MSAAFDAWLSRRAAAGDETAFAQLIEIHGHKLRNVVAHYAHESDTTPEDLAQVVAVKVWTEIQRGHYNPHRAPFAHFVTIVALQACRDDNQRRRARRRWPAEAPVDLDLVASDDWEDDRLPWAAPSAWYALDPALIVLHRERLRLAWQTLSDANRAHINRWLAVVPKDVVHPGLLGGWWLRSPSPKETPDEMSR